MVVDGKIIKIARKLFETGLINDNLLIDLYNHYNKDVGNTNLFIKRAKDLFPKLNCGLASVYLQKLLGEGEVIGGKYKDQDHTFLLLKRMVIDITADQYGGPRVYIGPLKRPWALF
jgi:hypothetical protein